MCSLYRFIHKSTQQNNICKIIKALNIPYDECIILTIICAFISISLHNWVNRHIGAYVNDAAHMICFMWIILYVLFMCNMQQVGKCLLCGLVKHKNVVPNTQSLYTHTDGQNWDYYGCGLILVQTVVLYACGLRFHGHLIVFESV